ALLITADPSSTSSIIERLTDANIAAGKIGVIEEAEFGCKMKCRGKVSELPTFNRDEIGKIFGQ
ncbi:uncharacterized protein METZ01_LOCUS301227, partial [marine metagenome]